MRTEFTSNCRGIKEHQKKITNDILHTSGSACRLPLPLQRVMIDSEEVSPDPTARGDFDGRSSTRVLQKEPGTPLGTAITAKFSEPMVTQADTLTSWLNRLFFQ